ncbi:MAG: hypothetical protein PHD70_03435 [Anaerostipes sp.]|nr:hypothetical protein [Anaerostipes sp.]
MKVLFGFIKYQKDKEKLQQFISKNKEIFSCVPLETCSTIEAVTNTKEIRKYMEKNENGVINVCQEIEDERMNDVKKAINDSKFREIMYQEYGIK